MSRKVKFPLVRNGTRIVYPDDRGLFKYCTVEGDFVVGEYFGEKPPEEIANYRQVIEVSVAAISGAISVTEGNTFAESRMGDILQLTIETNLPDGAVLRVPIRRVDDGRTVYAFSDVSGGAATLQLSLPTSGRWYCDKQLLSEEGRDGAEYIFDGLTILQAL